MPLLATITLGSGGLVMVAVMLSVFVVLLTTKLSVDFVFFGGVLLLLCTGTVTPDVAVSGFSAPVVVTVGALFFVTAGLEATGVLRFVLLRLFGRPPSSSRAVLRLMVTVSSLSALMSNTLIVSMFTPLVKAWSRRLSIAPSKLLIPLSYASCMGGMCLLIGTPANLVISEFYAASAGHQLNLFTPFVPGLCMVVLGTATMLLLHRLLPVRKTAEDALPELARSYAFKVRRTSHLVGLTLQEAGLPTDDGRIRLTGILRFDGEMCASPGEDDFLMGGDTLYYTGSPRHAVAVARRCDLEVPEGLAGRQSVRVSARMVTAIVLFAAMVLASSLGWLPLMTCSLIVAFLMVACRCVTLETARKSVSWELLMVFACSVVMGKAVDRSGIAAWLSEQLLGWCGANPRLALALMCVTASLLTEFVSNTACAAVLAPIALNIAEGCGASPLPFLVGLMVSCSASFMTPIGSPTHLIIYIPGGYRFSDFLRLGVVMSVVALAVAVLIVPWVFPF